MAQSHPKRRPRARKGRAVASARRAGGSRPTAWIAAAVVIAIGVALVITLASGTKHDPTHGSGASPAPRALVAAVTSIPAGVYSQVELGSAAPLPKPLPGPVLTRDGKPRIVYIGAEFCPYCATERWAMVAALARFGTFHGLQTSHSSSLDKFGDMQTLSFYKSSYVSPYISFEGVETQTNILSGSDYTTLEDPTADQQSLMNTFDVVPYVDKESVGAIPFVDFANRYLVVGATYAPQTLQGKSATEIAAAMRDPTTDIAKGAVGSANMMTAAICKLTNDEPANVCTDPGITGIERALR